MNFAILDAENRVINIVVAESDWQPAAGNTKREATEGCEIGGRWTEEGWEAKPSPSLVIPRSVSPLQARKALRAAGLTDSVSAFLSIQTEEVQEAWEYCVEVLRNDAFIESARTALGLSEEEVDDLFILAASL